MGLMDVDFDCCHLLGVLGTVLDCNQEKHYWKGMIPCRSGICQSNVLLWTKMTTLSEAWQKVMRIESIHITFPLLWANTCCSHPLFTNVELNGGPGAVAAAVRKVEHELGVTDLRPEECRVMGRFLYKAVMKDSLWGEHELDYVVITRGLSLSRLTPNPSEHQHYERAPNAVIITLSTWCINGSDKSFIRLQHMRSIADYSSSSEKADLGMLDFTITGDFTKTFNWNVKQLFVYLVAEYETPEN
ncbi:putative isopentenyl-diphosphate delta-isomerase, partial [Teladorsagia circumcincta]